MSAGLKVRMPGLLNALPSFLQRYVLHFEHTIDETLARFAAGTAEGVMVLDAGAGEGAYAGYFRHCRYVGVDLAIGDGSWNYKCLDTFADLQALPFRNAAFGAALNIVTLEHVKEPGIVLRELGRVLQPGGKLLVIAPHEWEEHQQPHDYYRFTRYGLRYLLERAGFEIQTLDPVGGFFRLLSRRLLNALQFLPFPVNLLAALLFVPAALLLPLLDGFDKRRNFTLGFVCIAVKGATPVTMESWRDN